MSSRPSLPFWTYAAGLLPGAAVVWLSYSAGGYFAGTTAVAAVGAAVVVAAQAVTGRRPLAGLSFTSLVPLGAFAGFAVWILLSSHWSHAQARAQIEYDRALLYALVLAGTTLPRGGSQRLRLTVRGLVLAFTAVAAGSLIVKTHPGIQALAVADRGRLAWPVSYWNALGLECALGLLLALHLTVDEHEHAAIRVGAAAVVPVLLSVLLLTQSRGALGAMIVGLLIYLAVVGGPGTVLRAWTLVPGALIVGLALLARSALTAEHPTDAILSSQGRAYFDLVMVAVALTVGLRAGTTLLEDRRPGWFAVRVPVRVRAASVGGLVLLVIVAAVAAGAPHRISRAFNEPVNTSAGPSRLTNLSNNGRVDQWRVAWRSFKAQPLHGTGAGTYVDQWVQHRTRASIIYDAHSLYLETLGELGIIGFLLLLAVLVSLLVALARRCRGPDAAIGAIALGVYVAWLLAAAVDWHWEMPAVTLGVFALGGAALSRDTAPEPATPRIRRSLGLRAVGGLSAALLCAGLCLGPLRVARSQSHLDSASAAFAHGDCNSVIVETNRAISALAVRPEPWELQAYCMVRDGRGRLARRDVDHAIALDPGSARLYFARALVVTATGGDPRRYLAQASARDPIGIFLLRFETALSSAPRNDWKRIALTTAVP